MIHIPRYEIPTFNRRGRNSNIHPQIGGSQTKTLNQPYPQPLSLKLRLEKHCETVMWSLNPKSWKSVLFSWNLSTNQGTGNPIVKAHSSHFFTEVWNMVSLGCILAVSNLQQSSGRMLNTWSVVIVEVWFKACDYCYSFHQIRPQTCR